MSPPYVVITLPGNERGRGAVVHWLLYSMTSPDLRHREMSKPTRGLALCVGVVLLI